MDAKTKQLILDYQTAFGSEYGKRVYDDLSKWSGYEDRIIPQGVPDITAFELGRRDMFLHIKDKVEAKLDEERQETVESEEVEE